MITVAVKLIYHKKYAPSATDPLVGERNGEKYGMM
jgi:hypothetical protein